MMCGGPSEVRACEEGSDDYTMIMSMRQQMEEKHGMPFEMFDIVHYSTQVVAGTNYAVKVQIGCEEWASVKIYKKLPHQGEEKEITAWKAGQTMENPISFGGDVTMTKEITLVAEPEEVTLVAEPEN